MALAIFLPLCLIGYSNALTFEGVQVERSSLIPPKSSGHETIMGLNLAKQQRASSCTACGNRSTSSKAAEERIVGGAQAGLSEFPWRVALFLHRGNGQYSYFCAATMLDNEWILTAAHCARGAADNNYDIVADIGDYDITTTSETTNQVRLISEIIVHPQFNNATFNNDIALLRVESAITTASNVGPICLPYKFRGSNFRDSTVVASGWGATKEGSSSTPAVLRKVNLPVLSPAQCRRYLGSRVNDNMLCTYQVGKDTCQGDSGGSIDYKDPSTGRYVAIGIVSWGFGCAQKDAPGVYTRLTRYLSWIEQTTGRSFCTT